MKCLVKQGYADNLKKANLRCTSSRIAILKVLSEAENPLTHRQIALALGKKAPNKVTIYRALESLVQAGLVHRAYTRGRAWCYELAGNCTDKQCHPHFTCSNCGQTYCLVGFFPPLVKGLKKGFVVYRQQVRLEGLCPECA